MSKDFCVKVKAKKVKKWVVVRRLGRSKFTKEVATKIAQNLIKKGREAKVVKINTSSQLNDALIKKWLRGDLDFDRRLMVKLARVARDSKTVLYVNYGKRTYEEQLALWNKYGPPRAARPGTSRHETGLAADVVTLKTKKNIGDVPRIRAAMKAHGLCLPVPNEPWHVEMGKKWRS